VRPLRPGSTGAELFLRTARGPSDFTGGDGTYSIPLGGDRTAWIFGDSFVGGVQRDGSRSNDPHTFVRNSLVLQDGADFRMVTGTEDGVPVDVARVPRMRENRDGSLPDEWYWPGHGTTSPAGDQLLVFMNRFSHPVDRAAGSTWDWKYRGTDLATIDARTGATTTIDRLIDGGDVLWGAAVLDRPDHTYVYGASDGSAHVARAPRGNLSDVASWEFWAGDAWSPDAKRSAALGPLVSNQFSAVDAKDGGVLLLSQIGFDQNIRAWHAPSPEGAFSGGGIVATIPKQIRQRHVYNTVAHPQFASAAGDLLVSYNVGGMDFMADHTSYRPGFLTIKASKLPGGGAAGPDTPNTGTAVPTRTAVAPAVS